jgi:trigger factor
MEYSLEELKNSRLKIKIEIPFSEFENYILKTKQDLKKNIQISGFRPGEAPDDLIETKVGKMTILESAAQEAIEDNYFKVISQIHYELIGEPEVKILKLALDNPFEFEVEVDILPKIEIPDYRQIAKETAKEAISVSEEEIKEVLNWVLTSRAQFENLERPAQFDDFVEIEYFSPDVEEGRVFKDAFFLGKGQLVKGFEENLVGLKAGEEKEFKILPQDPKNQNLPKKEISFNVKMLKVQKVNIPVLDDEFARKLGNFKDVDDLKRNIREGLIIEKENAAKQKWEEEFLKKIKEKTNFVLPEKLVEYQQLQLLENLKAKIKEELKMEFEDYLKQIKKTQEEVLQSLKMQAEEVIKNELLLREMIKKENIEATDQEIEDEINKFLRNFPSVEAAEKEIDLEKLKDYYRELIQKEKLFQILYNL